MLETKDELDSLELEFGAPTSSVVSDPDSIQDAEPNSPIHYNLRTLSYSSTLTLHSCPRRFELNRYLQRAAEDNDEHGHLSFGTVVGNGIQEYLVSGNLDKAMFRAFLDWDDELESERGLKAEKTFWHALLAVQKFVTLRNGPLAQYDVALFNDKPACELGFSIDCGNGFKYRGKLDALLVHRIKKEFLVLECKTTGSYNVDEASYKNSNQALGYGVVVDAVAHQMLGEASNSYDVLYPVYLTRKQEWREFKFSKSNTQRALWLQSLLLDINMISTYHDVGFFPLHGESCMSFNRQCNHFGLCNMSNKNLLPDLNKIPIKLDKRQEYPLRFSIQDLVEAQVGKS